MVVLVVVMWHAAGMLSLLVQNAMHGVRHALWWSRLLGLPCVFSSGSYSSGEAVTVALLPLSGIVERAGDLSYDVSRIDVLKKT